MAYCSQEVVKRRTRVPAACPDYENLLIERPLALDASNITTWLED